ncbi:MAG TPA: phosphoenolpyruvate carboxykinase (GTP), partial [Thermoplasmatales archaeon]|nr:phosphoenolpyruvate carboxykinase (GTP) [Thermoplasmatales archaeon]HEX08287.1 phosphoenolpyruvate carboxykinase (GTP) [Thermoplasmatales archaeon]
TPTGYIPTYEDLKKLFKEVLDKEYSKEDYIKQFMIRVPENLAKIERIKKIYNERVKDTPPVLFKILDEERKRLLDAREKYGEYISPYDFE